MVRPIDQAPGSRELPQNSKVSSKDRPSFEGALGRVKDQALRKEIRNSILSSSQKHNLPPELVVAVIHQESKFKPHAHSHVGARGLMQLMPGTARGLGVKNIHNVRENVEGGCKYLRQLCDKFGGNYKLALAAYNSGPGNVQKYGGIPPFKETQGYVEKIMGHFEELRTMPNNSVAMDSAIQELDLTLFPQLLHTAPEPNEPPSPQPPKGKRI